MTFTIDTEIENTIGITFPTIFVPYFIRFGTISLSFSLTKSVSISGYFSWRFASISIILLYTTGMLFVSSVILSPIWGITNTNATVTNPTRSKYDNNNDNILTGFAVFFPLTDFSNKPYIFSYIGETKYAMITATKNGDNTPKKFMINAFVAPQVCIIIIIAPQNITNNAYRQTLRYFLSKLNHPTVSLTFFPVKVKIFSSLIISFSSMIFSLFASTGLLWPSAYRPFFISSPSFFCHVFLFSIISTIPECLYLYCHWLQ